MGTWDTNALVIDISSYNGKIDLAQCVAGGVAGLEAKCSDGYPDYDRMVVEDLNSYKDPTFDDNVQQAYNNNIPVIAYHYFRTMGNPTDLLWAFKGFQYALKGKVPGTSYHAIEIDLEEEGETDVNIVSKLKTFEGWIRADPDMSRVPLLYYTRLEWLNRHRAVLDWISRQEDPRQMIMAQWPADTKIRCTWAQVKSHYPADTVKVLTPGFCDWKMWQWTRALYGMEGLGDHEVDTNFWHGDKNAMNAWLKFTPHEIVVPPPPPAPVGIKKHTIGIMNERSYAAVANNVVGSRPAGATVNYTDFVTQNGYTWGKTAEGTWIAIAIGSHPYVE